MTTPNEQVMLRLAYAVLTEVSTNGCPGVTGLARAWCDMYRALRERRDDDKTPAETPRSKRVRRN
jgi:hypothetical protein